MDILHFTIAETIERMGTYQRHIVGKALLCELSDMFGIDTGWLDLHDRHKTSTKVTQILQLVEGSWRDKSREEIASIGYVAHSLEAALLKAGRNELGGKFDNPRSSAALAVNGLGWFLERPNLLPPLPGLSDALLINASDF